MAEGDIGAIIDSLEFAPTGIREFKIIHISGDVYAIAHTDATAKHWVKTVSIDSAGNIGASWIDALKYDEAAGRTPDIIHVSGDVFAIVYEGETSHGYVCTLTIQANGAIGAAVIDSWEYNGALGAIPKVLNVGSGVFAVAYQGDANDGYLATFGIGENGTISKSIISNWEFDLSAYDSGNFLHVSGDVYAIAYQGVLSVGKLFTCTIATNGTITEAKIDSLDFSEIGTTHLEMIHVSDDVFAIAYNCGGNDGFLSTVEIGENGEIGAAVIDTWEFDTFYAGYPQICHISGNVFAITYQDTSSDGQLFTGTIATNGTITEAKIDSLEFDPVNCELSDILHISGDVYAVVYKGVGSNGFMITVDIETIAAAVAQHLLIMGVG